LTLGPEAGLCRRFWEGSTRESAKVEAEGVNGPAAEVRHYEYRIGQRASVWRRGLDRGGVPMQFTVGLKTNGKADRIVVDAEDALIAALRVFEIGITDGCFTLNVRPEVIFDGGRTSRQRAPGCLRLATCWARGL